MKCHDEQATHASAVLNRSKAISGKESPTLVGLIRQRLRCRVSYLALLLAFCYALPAIRTRTAAHGGSA